MFGTRHKLYQAVEFSRPIFVSLNYLLCQVSVGFLWCAYRHETLLNIAGIIVASLVMHGFYLYYKECVGLSADWSSEDGDLLSIIDSFLFTMCAVTFVAASAVFIVLAVVTWYHIIW